jgi:hypothetical protein
LVELFFFYAFFSQNSAGTKLDPQAGVYRMPESEYRARKSRKLRRELQEFALANGVPMMN